MVTSSNEPPLDTSIRVNDDFDCIADDYLGLVKVGNVGVWFLIDSGSAVTFIRESDAKFVSRHSNSARIHCRRRFLNGTDTNTSASKHSEH